MTNRALSFSVLLLAIPAGAHAGPAKNADPNRVICRTEEIIGSRLTSKRQCMTAQQWKDYQLETRKAIEKIQRFEYKQPGT